MSKLQKIIQWIKANKSISLIIVGILLIIVLAALVG